VAPRRGAIAIAIVLALMGAAACASTPSTAGDPAGAAPQASASARPPAAPPASAVAPTEPASSAPAPAPAPPFRSEEVFDLLVRGGDVVDGTGAARRRADVVVRGDRVVAVGEVDPSVRARVVLDAKGAVVTPGFVDAHAHADPVGSAPVLVAQGVTTIVVGQDGRSPGDGGDVGDWMRATEARRPVVSFAALVGHASVRVRANVGAAKVPSATALARMVALVEDAMTDGAVGLSTALEYSPGREAAQDELAAVAAPVARRDGVVMSHLRSEDDDAIEAAIDELLEQGRRSGARVHVAHLKVVGGRGAARAEALLAHLEKARAAGVAVTADWYPYTASYTGLEILFPDFARPPHDFAAARRDRKEDLRRHLRERVLSRNGPAATLFGTGPFAGKTLETAASERGIPFEDVLVDLGPSGASAAYFVMDEALQERLFLDARVMVGSDGGGGGGHPRGAGSFARVLEELVERRRVLSLEEAVRRMTSLPSETLRLGTDRGVIAPGAVADLVVFVPGEVRARATFTAPRVAATGMRHVVVAGQPVLLDGRATAARPGRALRAVPGAAPPR
jgi:N-acyl-D-amino-acid deacylase